MKKLLFSLMLLQSIPAAASELFIECKTKRYEELGDFDFADRDFILAISGDGKKIRFLTSKNMPLTTTDDRYQWSSKSIDSESIKKSGITTAIIEEINRVSGKYSAVIVMKDSSDQIIGKERLIGRGECFKVEKKL